MSKQEELPTAAKLKRWSKSGLIEEAVVYDHSTFQTEEFDRDNLGDLLKEEVVRRKDHEEDKEQALEEQREEFEQLIQNKIDELEEEKERMLPHKDSAVHGEYRGRENTLEELLEEVQSGE